MKKQDNRFETIFKEGGSLKEEGFKQIIVDKETGVNYLMIKCGYGLALTPLLDKDGKPIITKQ